MIKILPKEVADKIAAGEVIESPVSVVKELVENSIDSGATAISCEITKGGRDEIRVTDNGCGIPSEEVQLAFLRHATSKITSAEDLKSLDTLGFRGEALASIAAVSRLELITKTKEEKTGTKLVIHGGEIISQETLGCPDGTTLIVRDIFYNLPARAKFLKSEGSETGKIISMLSRLAITCPQIRFSFISNGKTQFNTNGRGDLYSSITSVYKEREYKELVPIKKTVDENGTKIDVFGYVSRPSLTKTNRRSQYFFVNGRAVSSKTIEKGLDLAYKERMFEGRYPIAFIFVDLDPKDIDVNIHPNKKEIKFLDEVAVISAVEKAVLEGITSKESVVKGTDTYRPTVETLAKDDSQLSGVVGIHDKVDIKQFLSTKVEEEKSTYKAGSKIESPTLQLSVDSYRASDIQEDLPANIPFDFDELTFGPAIFGTYLTATDLNNFYLFDQHASHERVNYEKLLNSYNNSAKESQILMTPFTFDAPKEMVDDQDSWLAIINAMGYNIELFGDNTYIVREIPIFMSMTEAEDFIKTFVDSYFDDLKTNNQVVVDKLIAKSCKASIKANDYIKDVEILALIDDLKKCNNPFSCPHGRPTFIKFSKYDIEKMFKRV